MWKFKKSFIFGHSCNYIIIIIPILIWCFISMCYYSIKEYRHLYWHSQFNIHVLSFWKTLCLAQFISSYYYRLSWDTYINPDKNNPIWYNHFFKKFENLNCKNMYFKQHAFVNLHYYSLWYTGYKENVQFLFYLLGF